MEQALAVEVARVVLMLLPTLMPTPILVLVVAQQSLDRARAWARARANANVDHSTLVLAIRLVLLQDIAMRCCTVLRWAELW